MPGGPGFNMNLVVFVLSSPLAKNVKKQQKKQIIITTFWSLIVSTCQAASEKLPHGPITTFNLLVNLNVKVRGIRILVSLQLQYDKVREHAAFHRKSTELRSRSAA